MRAVDVLNFEDHYSFSEDGKMFDKKEGQFLHPRVNEQSGGIYYRLMKSTEKFSVFSISTGLRKYFNYYGEYNAKIVKSIVRQYNLNDILSVKNAIDSKLVPADQRFYGNRLIFMRLCHNKSIKQVCKDMLVDVDQYCRYEETIQRPSNIMIDRLANYFGVDSHFFVKNDIEGLYQIKFSGKLIQISL